MKKIELSKSKRMWLYGLGVLIIIAVGAFFFYQKNQASASTDLLQNKTSIVTKTTEVKTSKNDIMIRALRQVQSAAKLAKAAEQSKYPKSSTDGSGDPNWDAVERIRTYSMIEKYAEEAIVARHANSEYQLAHNQAYDKKLLIIETTNVNNLLLNADKIVAGLNVEELFNYDIAKYKAIANPASVINAAKTVAQSQTIAGPGDQSQIVTNGSPQEAHNMSSAQTDGNSATTDTSTATGTAPIPTGNTGGSRYNPATTLNPVVEVATPTGTAPIPTGNTGGSNYMPDTTTNTTTATTASESTGSTGTASTQAGNTGEISYDLGRKSIGIPATPFAIATVATETLTPLEVPIVLNNARAASGVAATSFLDNTAKIEKLMPAVNSLSADFTPVILQAKGVTLTTKALSIVDSVIPAVDTTKQANINNLQLTLLNPVVGANYTGLPVADIMKIKNSSKDVIAFVNAVRKNSKAGALSLDSLIVLYALNPADTQVVLDSLVVSGAGTAALKPEAMDKINKVILAGYDGIASSEKINFAQLMGKPQGFADIAKQLTKNGYTVTGFMDIITSNVSKMDDAGKAAFYATFFANSYDEYEALFTLLSDNKITGTVSLTETDIVKSLKSLSIVKTNENVKNITKSSLSFNPATGHAEIMALIYETAGYYSETDAKGKETGAKSYIKKAVGYMNYDPITQRLDAQLPIRYAKKDVTIFSNPDTGEKYITLANTSDNPFLNIKHVFELDTFTVAGNGSIGGQFRLFGMMMKYNPSSKTFSMPISVTVNNTKTTFWVDSKGVVSGNVNAFKFKGGTSGSLFFDTKGNLSLGVNVVSGGQSYGGINIGIDGKIAGTIDFGKIVGINSLTLGFDQDGFSSLGYSLVKINGQPFTVMIDKSGGFSFGGMVPIAGVPIPVSLWQGNGGGFLIGIPLVGLSIKLNDGDTRPQTPPALDIDPYTEGYDASQVYFKHSFKRILKTIRVYQIPPEKLDAAEQKSRGSMIFNVYNELLMRNPSITEFVNWYFYSGHELYKYPDHNQKAYRMSATEQLLRHSIIEGANSNVLEKYRLNNQLEYKWIKAGNDPLKYAKRPIDVMAVDPYRDDAVIAGSTGTTLDAFFGALTDAMKADAAEEQTAARSATDSIE